MRFQSLNPCPQNTIMYTPKQEKFSAPAGDLIKLADTKVKRYPRITRN